MEKTMPRIPIWLRYIINAALFALFLTLGQTLINRGVIGVYYSKVLMLTGVNIILAVSLNVSTGYLGQLPLGHAGFMAVGAYACAILMKALPVSAATGMPGAPAVVVCLLFGGGVAALFGLIIGIPALRLRGDYLAIITLGFGEIIRVVLLNIDDLLGFKLTYGAASLKNIPKASSFFSVFLAVGLVCFFIHTMMKSRHGRAILSIRENEIAAESCGIRVTYYKTLGFVVSAFFAGVAGGLYAGYIGILSPNGFGFMRSIEILVMVVLGGMGSMIGSVTAASVLTILPQLLHSVDKYRMVVYSLLLILTMIFKPSGLFGRCDFSLGRLLERLLQRGGGKKAAQAAKGGEG